MVMLVMLVPLGTLGVLLVTLQTLVVVQQLRVVPAPSRRRDSRGLDARFAGNGSRRRRGCLRNMRIVTQTGMHATDAETAGTRDLIGKPWPCFGWAIGCRGTSSRMTVQIKVRST